MLSQIACLSALVSTGLAATESMSFAEVQEDQRTKVVFFTNGSEECETVGAAHAALSDNEAFSEYTWVVVNVNGDSEAEEAFPPDALPLLFTMTPEGGIGQFGTEISEESFKEYHEFRTMDVTEDKVVRYESEAQILELAQTKPVFLKMYEEWCGHCKKLKKHWQAASNVADQVHWVEVECSASGSFCDNFGVEGYPTLKVLNVGATKYGDINAREFGPLAAYAKAGEFTYESDVSLSTEPAEAIADEYNDVDDEIEEQRGHADHDHHDHDGHDHHHDHDHHGHGHEEL